MYNNEKSGYYKNGGKYEKVYFYFDILAWWWNRKSF